MMNINSKLKKNNKKIASHTSYINDVRNVFSEYFKQMIRLRKLFFFVSSRQCSALAEPTSLLLIDHSLM